jgi:glucose-1-phosphate cytidylyltransferase
MKVVILAGGLGTRLAEETSVRPKPMVEIGGMPIICHIMNIYAAHGIREFIVAAGYKAEALKDYFLNFYALNSDLSIDLSTGETVIHRNNCYNWKIHIVDTGLHTQTGGRLKRLAPWLANDETFCFTYGDGVSDVDIETLIKYHHANGRLATVTTVHAPARFGRIAFEGNHVSSFHEKAERSEGWINGGYFVLNRRVLDYIQDDGTIWEREPIERLAAEGQLIGYRHGGFWSCMDTLKEKQYLEELWSTGKAPWKIWK